MGSRTVEDQCDRPVVHQGNRHIGPKGSRFDLETLLTQGRDHRLDDLQIALSDIALHKPTLDDVFLSLTGHAAADGQEPEPETAKKRRRGRRDGGES